MNPENIPDEWIETFGRAWASVPEGDPGDRRRAGLAAVEPLIRARVRAEERRAARRGVGNPLKFARGRVRKGSTWPVKEEESP